MGADSRGQIDHHAMTWSGIAAFSSVAAILVVIVVIVAAVKFQRSRHTRKVDPRSLATRARLFSRDRLDTTEYMNNLATLDRKLAMDEILEKRRRVIFTPAVSCELRGGPDDVFVDVIGPIDLVDDHRTLKKPEPWTMN